MWSWTRSAIPEDIRTEQPNSTSWGTPVAGWDASTCDPWSLFHPQQLVMNINYAETGRETTTDHTHTALAHVPPTSPIL